MQRSKKSKEERRCLPSFFVSHISKITVCENCGLKIENPDAKNVAHILPKSSFKSVMCEPQNAMYLCTGFDRQDGKTGCHESYDYSWGSAAMMSIWKTARKRFQSFENKVEERSIILLNFIN